MTTKYFIGGSPGREVVRQFMDDYSDYPDQYIMDQIMDIYPESWMTERTQSQRKGDNKLLHMIRSIRSK